jgi:DNA-binding transcriptional LysR family regulator
MIGISARDACSLVMARHIDIVTLQLFIAVCEEGNIARAADREAIDASAVSRRIAAIEEDIGAPLLVRGRRGIKPTAAGETLLRQAREVLRVMDRLNAELSDFSNGVQGHVRVVATPAVLAEDLAEDIGTFLDKCPQVRVSTDERVSVEVVRAVREGAAEIGVLWDASDLSELHVEPYRRDHLCLAVRAGHPLAKRSELRFEEVLDQIAVGVAPGGMMDILLRREAARLSRTLVHRVQVSGIDAAVRFVAAGLGPAVLPREAAMGHAKARSLVFLPLAEDWAQRQFTIVTRGGYSETAATRMLIQHLRNQAGSA